MAQSPWSDVRVLAKVLELTLPSITAREPIEAWIIDDTSFPKKGKHSVGVTRQYSGQLGKQDNCQVAVSLSLANAGASFPIAYRLYLPKDWYPLLARHSLIHVMDAEQVMINQALDHVEGTEADQHRAW